MSLKIKDPKLLPKELLAERDDLRAQLDAIQRVLRRYRLTRGSRGMRRMPPNMETYPQPSPCVFSMRNILTRQKGGPMSAEDTLEEIRNILRR